MNTLRLKGLEIESVVKCSIAEEFELSPGDHLLAVNGHLLRDIIDYSYYTAAEEELLLEIEKPDGEIWELEVEREAGEPLGLTFTPPEPANCRNKCLFCFVHQLPKGLRKPLYVKDEDYRLSFLNGNYVTLANLKEDELARIVEQRLSPLYVSVHATNSQLREKLLGVNGIPPILEQLQKLAAARIRIHTQVVLCPGLNDGVELERTINDLASLYPTVVSLAVVPLGLTSHRKGLPALTPVDARYAADFIAAITPVAKAVHKKIGELFLFLADEWYLKAGVAFPPLKEYGDLPQIENGVGMVPLFMKDAKKTLRFARKLPPVRVTVVTGKSIFPLVENFVKALAVKSSLEIFPVAVENRLFGSSVTVTGLLCGADILDALKTLDPGSAVLIPDVMVKEGESLFLDDMSLTTLQELLGCPVLTFDSTPSGFYSVLKCLSSGSDKL